MLVSLLLFLSGISLVSNMLLLLRLRQQNRVLNLLLQSQSYRPWHLQSLTEAMTSQLTPSQRSQQSERPANQQTPQRKP